MPCRSRLHDVILPTLAVNAEYPLFTHIYIFAESDEETCDWGLDLTSTKMDLLES